MNANMNPPIRTGFVGAGNQGAPMAMRMVRAGFPLMVFARRPEVIGGFREAGASIATSIAELGQACDHVGICVVNDEQVAQVCDELIPAMATGGLIAMHSTILPATCEALERECAQRGLHFLDAPVSGGAHVAQAGELTLMCGGTQAAFAQALPVLETFGKLIVLLGDSGAGQKAKIVNNALLAANMGAAWAATEAAADLGLDRAAFNQVIAHSSGRSLGFEIVSRMGVPRDFPVGAPLLVKDVALLCTILEDSPQSAILRRAAEDFLTRATS